MIKILLFLAICTLCGCVETPHVKGKTYVDVGSSVKEVEIKGHSYLLYDAYNKGNIIHAEHCQCKNK